MTEQNLNTLKSICSAHHTELLTDEYMAPYTSFKIGGPCDALVRVNSGELLAALLRECAAREIPLHVIGRGCNILVPDEGVRGLVCVFGRELGGVEVRGETLVCGAGAGLSKVCGTSRDHALKGLEFAYGIPASVGGAVYMNAGAYGGEMGDVVSCCRYLDRSGESGEIHRKDMQMAYRSSIFKERGYVILEAEISLEQGEKFRIEAAMQELMERRRSKQPLDYPSAGSTFKRPKGAYASQLIDECGLKGLSVGGAAVSEKHAGFVVNKGGATFCDVMQVIEMVQGEVYKKTGFALECEVEIVK